MNRALTSFVMGLFLVTIWLLGAAWGAELKVIQSQKTKDMVITLLSESGQWTQGKNSFALAFTSVKTHELVDAGKVSLNTNMPMPGMSPMIAGATLTPDNAPGRYQGTISFPDSGAPSLDENLMLVEVNRLDATREVLEGQVDILRLQLGTLLGLEPDTLPSVRGELYFAPVMPSREEGLMRALTTRPDLLAARTEVEMAGAKVRKEEAEGRWDANVNVGYMRQDFGYGLSGLTERGELRPITDVFHYVGGGVTVTLPVRNRNQGNIAAALAEAQAGGHRLDAATLMVRQDVAAAFTQREAAERALATYTRGVWEVARQNLAVVRKAYELGRHPLLDVIAEQRRYIEVEMGYTDVLKHTYDAAVSLDRALGVVPH